MPLTTSAYNATTDQYANKTTKGWGFYQSNGNKGHGGPANSSYASKYNVGDTVDVQVCSATREIRFFVNGADRGVAYNNLPVGTPLYAAVSLYQKDAQTVYNGLVNTTPWLSSTRHKGTDIVISGNTVTKTAQSWGTGTAIVSDGITLQHGSSVKKRWSFTIKKGTQQTVGVVTAAYDATRDEYVNKTTKGWGIYQANGNKGHGGSANTAYTSKFNAGDTVDV